MQSRGWIHKPLMFAFGGAAAWITTICTLFMQQGATHLDVTVSDVLAFAGFLTGPPTALVAGMWFHLHKRMNSLQTKVEDNYERLNARINQFHFGDSHGDRQDSPSRQAKQK